MMQESDVDRMIRQAAESKQTAQAARQRVEDFYESAIDYAVADVAMPVTEGLRSALGDVSATESVSRSRGTRTFRIRGRSPVSHVNVELVVTVNGAGPVVANPREIGFTYYINAMILAPGRTSDQFRIAQNNESLRPVPSAQFIRQTINAKAKAFLGL